MDHIYQQYAQNAAGMGISAAQFAQLMQQAQRMPLPPMQQGQQFAQQMPQGQQFAQQMPQGQQFSQQMPQQMHFPQGFGGPQF